MEFVTAKTRTNKSRSKSSRRLEAAVAKAFAGGKSRSISRGKKKNSRLQKTFLPVQVSRHVTYTAEILNQYNVYADGGDDGNEPIQPSNEGNKEAMVIPINRLHVPIRHLDNHRKGLRCVEKQVTYFVLCPRARSLEETRLAIAGMSAKLIEAYCKAINLGNNNKRGNNCNIRSDASSFKYVCSGAAANRASPGVTPIHYVIRNLDGALQKLILAHFRGVERLFKAFLPTVDIRQVLGGIELVDAETFTITNGESSEIFAAFAVGKNVYLSCHIDDDFTYSCTTLLCSDESKKDKILAYFCFPRLGIAVPLRPGDTLFFNAREPHMISSRTNNEIDIYCLSFYLKSNVIGGNDNKKELSEDQEHYANLFEEKFT